MQSKALVTLCLTSFAAGASVAVCRYQKGEAPYAPPPAGIAEQASPAATATAGSSLFQLPQEAAEPALRALVEKELAKTEPDPLRLEAVFMRWFDQSEDLSKVFKDLLAKHPACQSTLIWAYYTAWAWHDCDAAVAAAKETLSDARVAVWKVACALGHPAAMEWMPLGSHHDFSPAQRLVRREPSLAPELLGKVANLYWDDDHALPQLVVRGWIQSEPVAALTWLSQANESSNSPNINRALLPLAGLMLLEQDPTALNRIPAALREQMEARPDFRIIAGLPPLPQPGPEESSYLLQRLDPCRPPAEYLRLELAQGTLETTLPHFFASNHLTLGGPDWADTDPAGTLDEFLTLEQGPAVRGAVSLVLNRWNIINPGAARDYAAAHHLKPPTPPPPTDTETLPGVLPLSEVLERLSTASPENPLLNTSITGAAERDPAGTLQWLEQDLTREIPDPRAWQDLVSAAVRTVDLPTATEWTNQLPKGPLRDAAVSGMMTSLCYDDPLSALSWAASTSEPEIHTSEIASSLLRIVGSAGAPIMVRNSSVPDKIKEAVIARLSH